jgi:GWxTD domain-containing protein
VTIIRLTILTLCCLGLAIPRAGAADRGERAERLYRQALERLAAADHDSRRLALEELDQARLLDPSRLDIELTLARECYASGFLRRARQRWERALELDPDNAEARFGIARLTFREWRKYLDRERLDQAVEEMVGVVKARPAETEAWLMLSALLVEQEDLERAAVAAEGALASAPGRPDAALAGAYVAYRRGDVARAESLFAYATPRMPPRVRERFEDIAPIASARDTFVLNRLSPEERREYRRQFWKEHDPDLASPENEAQLEYWSRVTHAYFLFYDARRQEWDERGEVYVRYGRPAFALYNPAGAPLVSTNPYLAAYPLNLLVWGYPELGMTVVMEDRTLNEFYYLPVSTWWDPDPLPNPAAVEERGDQLLTRAGRGVFPVLPPRAEPRPMTGQLARFDAAAGGRLLALVETPGEPGDTLIAEWVVLDPDRREVVRQRRAMGPSACDPAAARVADFDAELPPGEYVVGLTVRDARGRRGVYRATVRLTEPSPELRMSDLVVACGPPTPGPPIRIEPNPAARVHGEDPLTAYFEVYHLTPGTSGRSRFEISYLVRSAAKDERVWLQRVLSPRQQPAPISASRADENPGPLRRQFVSIPVQTLPPGRYRVEVRVKDLATGAETARSAEFERLGPSAPSPGG